MSYAIWQADISIIPIASASWVNGCCTASSDCGGNFVCYPRPAGLELCEVLKHYDRNCDCMVIDVTHANYCNPPGHPPGMEGGDGHAGTLD